MPALTTCPGRTTWCFENCYADKGHYVYPNVRDKYESNLNRTYENSFVDVMIKEIRRLKENVIRIHSSGDFYDEQYIEDWIDIVKANSDKSFYTYTRSYRIQNLLDRLKELASLPNFKMFISIDETIPERDYNYLTFSKATVEGIGVPCRAQNEEDITCDRCGICFNKKIKTDVRFKKH